VTEAADKRGQVRTTGARQTAELGVQAAGVDRRHTAASASTDQIPYMQAAHGSKITTLSRCTAPLRPGCDDWPAVWQVVAD
jgi:hypothetical protein